MMNGKLTLQECNDIIIYVRKNNKRCKSFILNRDGETLNGNYWQILPTIKEPNYKNLTINDNIPELIKDNFDKNTKLFIKSDNSGQIIKIKYEVNV